MSWDEIEAQLAGLGEGIEEKSVKDLDLTEILDELAQIDETLNARRELLFPFTSEGRELHSRRGALTVEKHNRLRHIGAE